MTTETVRRCATIMDGARHEFLQADGFRSDVARIMADHPEQKPGDLTTEQQCQMVAEASVWRTRALKAEAELAAHVSSAHIEWSEDEVRQSIRSSVENGSTLALFARTLGVQRSHLYEFLNGKRGPGNELLHKIGFRWAILRDERYQEEDAPLPAVDGS